MDRLRRTIAALGAMFGCSIFGGIGDAARKERLAPAREILRFGQSRQDREDCTVEMGLGEVEADVGDAAHQRLQARLGIGRDQIGKFLRLPVGKRLPRSEEHTSELQSLMRISYAVFCLKKKTQKTNK